MLYPYLTGYFTGVLGLSAAAVGLVLGVRVMAQQGSTLFTGILADRIGYRTTIILGFFLRTIGFALFAVVTDFPGLMVATLLSGLAGALFGPASRAYLTVLSGDRRAEAYALLNVFGQTGVLLGPLVGLALLGISFSTVALVAAALFGVLGVLQLFFLPPIPPTRTAGTPLGQLGEVVGNRTFLLFSLAMFGNFAMFNQMYLGLPLQITRLTGSDAGVGLLLTISSLVTIVVQVPMASLARRTVGPAKAIIIGLTLMAASFGTSLAVAIAVGAGLELDPAWVLVPSFVNAGVLALGTTMINPFSLELVTVLAQDRLLGTHIGVYQAWSGIGTTVSNLLVGMAFDAGNTILPWALVMTIGFGSALGVLLLERTGRLNVPRRLDPTADATPA